MCTGTINYVLNLKWLYKKRRVPDEIITHSLAFAPSTPGAQRISMVSHRAMFLVAFALFGGALAQPAKEGFWKGTPMDGLVEDMRSGCAEGSDPTACIKFKVMSLLDTIFKKDVFQVI